MKVECGWSNFCCVPSWQEPPPALLRVQDDTEPRLGGGGFQRESLPGKLHMGREQGYRPLPMGPGNRKVNEVHIGKSTYLKELVQSVYCCTTKVHSSQKVHVGRLTRKWHFTTLWFSLTVATNIIHRGRRHFPSRGFTESLHPIRTTTPHHFSTKPVSLNTTT